MGARHRDHYYGGLLTRSSDTNTSRQPRPTETEGGSRRDAQHTRIRGAITASCNRKAIGTDGHLRPKSGNSLTSVLGTIPSPRRCESRRRSNAPERKSRGLFLRHTRWRRFRRASKADRIPPANHGGPHGSAASADHGSPEQDCSGVDVHSDIMRRSGVSGLRHRPDEAVARNRAARRSPVDRLVFLTATCPSLHLLRSDAGPGRETRLSANPTIVSFTYGDMRHFCIRMLSRSHRRRRYKIGERCGGAPVRWARDGSWARSRRGGRLRGSGGGGSGRPRPCRLRRTPRPRRTGDAAVREHVT